MSKVRRFQFGMGSLVLLMTVACVAVGIYQAWHPSKVDVLVATEYLDHKTAITKTNVKFETWPAELVPEGAITLSDGIPVGNVNLTRFRKGQVLIGEDVVDPATVRHVTVPPGFRVVNVKLPIEDGSCGLLSPGDRVDVIAVGSNGNYDSAKSILKNVRVFNFATCQSEPNFIVGLLITDEQAITIAKPKAAGQLRLVLRGDSGFLE